jgi:hypothetical protein
MAIENAKTSNSTNGYLSMIFLFDNCYLSTTNNIVETAKHIWIGNHKNIDDPQISYCYDIYQIYSEATPEILDELFQDIHENFSDIKTIIYCDVDSFQYVYSFFYGAILDTSALTEMYSYDRLKENYGLGSYNYGMQVTGLRETTHVDLPEQLQCAEVTSEFAASLENVRVEVEYANALQGDEEAMQFCIDRVDQMYDGSPGFWLKFAEQTLPAIMSDEEYTIENITDEDYIKSYLTKFDINELMPVDDIHNTIKEVYGYDYGKHFFSVVNNTQEYDDIVNSIKGLTKRELVENYLLEPVFASQHQLVFPNLSNFDSVNPIFWNAILQNRDNTEWLSKYKVTHGTDNQTNGIM